MALERATRTRRVWLPAAAFGLFALVVFGRLVQLQILEHDRYAAQARSELLDTSTILAERGSILDRNGYVLSTSVDTWDIYVSTRAWEDELVAMPASLALAEALDMDAGALREKVATSELVDIVIARDVPYETGLALTDGGVAGVAALPNIARANPEGDAGASLLGLIGIDNTGLAGIEASFDSWLQGSPGRLIYERDTTGDPIPFGDFIALDPEPGGDVILTIDRYLQKMSEEMLAQAILDHDASGGAIIIMDTDTGELLALATSPALTYSNLDLDDPEQLELLRNPAVTDLYEPGSVMKVITAASAIDAGVVSPHTSYTDTGEVFVYGTRITNWSNRTYGDQTMTGVLQKSINTGAVFMAELLGADAFHRYLAAFGFGHQTGVELQGEAEGILRQPDDDGWSPVDLATQSYGQSISVTPLQMISAIAATVNGGRLLQPHIVKATVDADGLRHDVAPKIIDRPISPETSATMRQMLADVVNPGSTHPAQPKNYIAGGKSGTADVPLLNGYGGTQIASFVGFAPIEHPEVVVLVTLNENADLETGTAAAGPVVADVLDKALAYLNVPPDALNVRQP